MTAVLKAMWRRRFVVLGGLALTAAAAAILVCSWPTRDHKKRKQVAPEKAAWLGQEMLMALARNEPDKARRLFEEGADATYTVQWENRRRGATILMAACLHGGYPDIVKWLIDEGADVNAESQYHEDNGMTALFVAAESGSIEIIRILLERGAAIDAGNGKPIGPPLLGEAKEGHQHVVQELLRRGADVNGRNSWGVTALAKAAGNGDVELVRILLTAGADPTILTESKGGRVALRSRPLMEVQALLFLLRRAKTTPPNLRDQTLKKIMAKGLREEGLVLRPGDTEK